MDRASFGLYKLSHTFSFKTETTKTTTRQNKTETTEQTETNIQGTRSYLKEH